MPNTFFPTQIGYRPTGVAPNVSTLYFGRIVSGAAPFDGPGFGSKGRPDYLQTAMINLVQNTAGVLTQVGTITLNVGDLLAVQATRGQFPTNLNLTLKEVLVCDAGSTKGMMIVGSQTYPTGAA
jgi:hypothetical protein